MLSIIVTLYSFGMLIRVIFTFLANFKNIKFCIYLEFIKVLTLKFLNYIKTYNSWFIKFIIFLLLVAMVAFLVNLKKSTFSNCYSLFNFLLSKD